MRAFLSMSCAFVVHALQHRWSFVWLRGWDSSWWRSLGLTERRIWPCSTVDSFLKDYMHLPHVQHVMPASQYGKRNQGIVSQKRSRKAQGIPCCPCWWSTPSTFRWMDWIPQSCSNPQSTSPGSGDSRTVESVFWRFPCDSSLLSGRLSEVYLEFCKQRYRDRFPCTSRFVRFDGRWIFSLRG